MTPKLPTTWAGAAPLRKTPRTLPPRSTTAMTIVSRPIARAAPVMALVTSAAAHWARAGEGASATDAARHVASVLSRTSHRNIVMLISGDRTVPVILAETRLWPSGKHSRSGAGSSPTGFRRRRLFGAPSLSTRHFGGRSVPGGVQRSRADGAARMPSPEGRWLGRLLDHERI